MKRRAGFTLIELLVVIAIIAILAAMLLPALAAAKTQARKTEEMGAAHQLMLAMQMYADDHENQVLPGYWADTAAVDDAKQPLSFPENARYPWRIVPYLGGSMASIYSGVNRQQLYQLQSENHSDYVYAVSVFPSLGINSYFIGGNQTEFQAAAANTRFGSGTVVLKYSDVMRPTDLAAFMSARSAVSGNNAQGYYQITPPYLTSRVWATSYADTLAPNLWGFVAPRFNKHIVSAEMDGHGEEFSLTQSQDMRHWCNRATNANWVLGP